MKRFFYILFCAAVMAVAVSCEQHELPMPENFDDRIEITLSSSATKAEDLDYEAYLNQVDILIFNIADDKPGTVVYHERINVQNAASSVLAAKRSDFTAKTSYYVQVIANSTAKVTAFSTGMTYDAVNAMQQEDSNVHLTGLANNENAPDYFLMDGVAYLATDSSKSASVVLNDGVPSNNTELAVTLKRAAAKFELFITAGTGVDFQDGLEGGNPEYYIRNLPIETYVLDHAPTLDTKLQSTTRTKNDFFAWNAAANTANLKTYAYAHAWDPQAHNIIEKEPCIIVNLPMKYTSGGVTTEHPSNWYKIPMSAQTNFDRNKYYKIEVTINMPGNISMGEAVEIGSTTYEVRDWTNVNINVGDQNNPAYLFVNQNELEIYNANGDDTTLEFYSSSEVEVEISDAYYYDKFGQIQTVSRDILYRMRGTAEGLSGNVDIDSPNPTNNTIRYYTLTLKNDTGQTQTVTVKQYPLEYIVGIQAWYSYRTDFGTTYESQGENRYNTTTGYNPDTNKWTYDDDSDHSFFTSKYAEPKGGGKSDIYYYKWERGKPIPDETGKGNDSDHGISGNENARIYHVRITASSGTYTLGRPQLTSDGITDGGDDNKLMVSPSFMIASQLGAVWSSGLQGNSGNQEGGDNSSDYDVSTNEERTKMAASHCHEYVEVYKDGDKTIHLDDWRLPTEAELEIIARFQRIEGSAIDEVLGGRNYYSASGPYDLGQGDKGTFLRCIRDAY